VVTEYATPTHNKATRSLKDVPRTVVPLMPSNITGPPKPPTSPSYPNFKLWMNAEELRGPAVDDLSWLLVRHYHRNDVNPHDPVIDPAEPRDGSRDGEEVYARHQNVTVWTAYNSLLRTSAPNTEFMKLDKVHALPLINAPAHEWTTLTTALTQLSNLNKLMASDNQDNEPILVWLDMDLYKRVRKLSFLDLQFQGNIITSPGPFHVVLCALRCLGVTLESSGLDEAWIEAGLYSSVTVAQILNGKHHNRLFVLSVDSIYLVVFSLNNYYY
jgi:hypothetical protein